MDNNSKLYTGNGDKGYTRTHSNFRISKADNVIEVLGCIDEVEAALGFAGTFVTNARLAEDIEKVQRKLLDIAGEVEGAKTSVTKECVAVVEEMIDFYQDELKVVDKVGISGKTRAASALKMAYTASRRLERALVKAGQFGRFKPELCIYLNRLADLIFVFAKFAEKDGGSANTEAIKIDNSITPQNAATLTLSMAKLLSEEIEKQGKAMGLNIVVAIADSGANLMLLHSMDDAYIASSKIAQDKAYTSVALKMPTITALELSRGGALDGLSYTSENRIILLGGGEPLKIGGKIVGGLGVSGGTAEEDTALARFGAELFSRLYK